MSAVTITFTQETGVNNNTLKAQLGATWPGGSVTKSKCDDVELCDLQMTGLLPTCAPPGPQNATKCLFVIDKQYEPGKEQSVVNAIK